MIWFQEAVIWDRPAYHVRRSADIVLAPLTRDE
jgi:hypothetical protein